MATLRVVGGALEVEAAGDRPGHPAHPIVPGPVDPGWGVEGPVDPGYGLPLPPVATHPIAPGGEYPSHQPLPPTYPVDPDYGLPIRPGVWPSPPTYPDQGLPPPVAPGFPIYLPPPGPDNELPMPPGSVWPPLPPGVTGELLCLVWIVGVGYRWTVIDTTLKPDNTLPGLPPARPSHDLPPTAQPR